jgi:hypothetical protein
MGDRDHWEDICINLRIILKLIVKKWGGGMPWIGLAVVRDIVNAVMNVWVL